MDSSKTRCWSLPLFNPFNPPTIRSSKSVPGTNGNGAAAESATGNKENGSADKGIHCQPGRLLDLVKQNLKDVEAATKQLKENNITVDDQIEKASKGLRSLQDEVKKMVKTHPESTDGVNMEEIEKEVHVCQKSMMKLKLLNLVKRNLKDVEAATNQLKEYNTSVDKQIGDTSTVLLGLQDKIEKMVENSLESADGINLEEIEKEVHVSQKTLMKLQLQLPSMYQNNRVAVSSDDQNNENQQHNGLRHHRQDGYSKMNNELPNLAKNEALKTSPEFEDFKVLYESLDVEEKLCLLCFSVFAENEIIRKTFMIYWWIGEGFVRPKANVEETAEQLGNEVFIKLMSKGFIEHVPEEEHCPEVKKCKMHPFVRAAVIILADMAKFFEFDMKGNLSAIFPRISPERTPDVGPTNLVPQTNLTLGSRDLQPKEEDPLLEIGRNVGGENFHHKQKAMPKFSHRACLFNDKKWTNSDEYLDKIQTLFNVNETNLDFQTEWFSRMKNLNVLCLGRWETFTQHHIEVEDTQFLESLKNMKCLKFLSLQGISRIMDLKDFTSKLENLLILDLRACYNLEVLPDQIGNLKSLTHLDLSECYLLSQMPKELSLLKELQVLKGFVVGNWVSKKSCTLKDLIGLSKLRKLSIYTAKKKFPEESEVNILHKFPTLTKLTISWGKDLEDKSEKRADIAKGAERLTAADTTKPEKSKTEDKGQDNANAAAAEAAAKKETTPPEAAAKKETTPPEAAAVDKSQDNAGRETAEAAPKEEITPIEAAAADKSQDNAEAAPKEAAVNKSQDNAVRETAETSAKGQKTPVEAAVKKVIHSVGFAASATTNPANVGDVKHKHGATSTADSSAGTATRSQGSTLSRLKSSSSRKHPDIPLHQLPAKLMKLDLQCCPLTYASPWLQASKLGSLKKLYIRGGTLKDLGQFELRKEKWESVEILRLKFLNGLDMDWRELQELFPKLTFLEKVNCPKLVLFPCDEHGVWRP